MGGSRRVGPAPPVYGSDRLMDTLKGTGFFERLEGAHQPVQSRANPSPTSNSLFDGKIQGISRFCTRLSSLREADMPEIPRVSVGNSLSRRTGNFRIVTGKNLARSGKFGCRSGKTLLIGAGPAIDHVAFAPTSAVISGRFQTSRPSVGRAMALSEKTVASRRCSSTRKWSRSSPRSRGYYQIKPPLGWRGRCRPPRPRICPKPAQAVASRSAKRGTEGHPDSVSLTVPVAPLTE